MPDISLLGATYPDVPAVTLPVDGGGTAQFDWTADADATAEDILAGKIAYVNGQKITGTGSSGTVNLKPFVLRPDAVKIHTVTYDKLLVKDEKIEIPAYSTTAKTLKASENLTPTVEITPASYDYQVVERLLAYPIYAEGTAVATGRFEYWLGTYLRDIVEIPANTFRSMDGSKSYGSRVMSVFQAGCFYRELYWSSTTALTTYSTASYGIYMGSTAPSASSTTITLKSPTLNIRGHATYLRSAVWSTITDIRYQDIMEVYRVPKGSLNLDGWGARQSTMHIFNDIDNNNGTLT